MIKKIVNNNMDEATKAKLAVVDFSATWCGPCRMLEPVLEEISEDLAGKAEFYNADVDENMKLAMQYDVQSVPALIIMKDGKVADRTVGFQPKASIMEFINRQM
ncbi:MAG: thioredoxin [Coprococcus sp.]|nr:thioredoxin [Coprococcus sp.]